MEIPLFVIEGDNGHLPTVCGVGIACFGEGPAMKKATEIASKGKAAFILKPIRAILPARPVEVVVEELK